MLKPKGIEAKKKSDSDLTARREVHLTLVIKALRRAAASLDAVAAVET